MNLLLRGNARSIPLADESVHCVITSPPYWGLRDYGTAQWEGGDAGCDHVQGSARKDGNRRARHGVFENGDQIESQEGGKVQYRDTCGKCGARRVDRQLGLEQTPEAYVAAMVAVFREVWRVLRDDGTCWINIGDSYASSPPGNTTKGVSARSTLNGIDSDRYRSTLESGHATKRNTIVSGLKPKDVIGIPWRLALALQADGWYLRDPIVWAKAEVNDDDELEGSAMPGSQRDRCTSAYEFVFTLAKRERYFWDGEACKAKSGAMLRNVWRINPEPTKIKHFATFPRELARRCVLLSTSERGCCPQCGAPWVRVGEVSYERAHGGTTGFARDVREPDGRRNGTGMAGKPCLVKRVATLGWQPSCPHGDLLPIPATVFDPFAGSGTTLVVAEALGRRAIGLDLSREYLTLARRRIERPHAVVPRPGRADDLPLFREAVACQENFSPEGD
jgi:DNA modification methylase